MSKMQSKDLRAVAQDLLSNTIGESVDDEQLRELVTAVVRQWITYENHAGVIFSNGSLWLKLVHKGGSDFDVGVMRNEGCSFLPLLRSRRIELDDMSVMLHRLNLSQSVELENVEGQRFKFWVDPRERRFGIDAVEEPDS